MLLLVTFCQHSLAPAGTLSSISIRCSFSSPLLLVHGGDQHAAGGNSHHLPRRQVQDGDGRLADQLLRLVVLVDAGEDDAVRAAAVVQGELQQLVGLLHRLAVLDLHGAEIGLQKRIEVYLVLHIGLQLHG